MTKPNNPQAMKLYDSICTLGFAQSLFGKVFDCEIKAELIESIKTGGSRCVVKIGRFSYGEQD